MSRYVEVIVDECLKTTDKAALLEVGGDQFWVPFSQMEDNGEDVKECWCGPLYLTRWICEENGIEYFESDD